MGVMLLVGSSGALAWAGQRVPSSVSALANSTVPLWIVLIDSVRGQRRLRPWDVAGALLGLMGTALLLGPTSVVGSGATVRGPDAVALLLGALSWSLGSLYGRSANLPTSPMLANGLQMTIGGAVLLVLSGLMGEWQELSLSTFAPRSIWGLAFLMVFSAGIAFSAYTWLLRVAPTPLVATYAYVNPVVAIALGRWLGGEEITLRIIVAAMTIVGAVVVIARSHPDPANEMSAKDAATA